MRKRRKSNDREAQKDDSKKIEEFINSIVVLGDDKMPIIVPVNPEDNQRLAQIEVARLGSIINKWFQDKHTVMEATPREIKEIASALDIKHQLAERAYRPITGSTTSTDEIGESIIKDAIDAAAWVAEMNQKEIREAND
jgi:hypothetical protein